MGEADTLAIEAIRSSSVSRWVSAAHAAGWRRWPASGTSSPPRPLHRSPAPDGALAGAGGAADEVGARRAPATATRARRSAGL